MAADRQYGQYRDFDRVQTARWNKLACSQESRNLLNYDIILEDMTMHTEVNQGRVLLNGARLQLLRGRKYGLVGRNGVGKTTLLKLIANHKIMGIYDHLRCIYIDDATRASIENPDTTCIGFLLDIHRERLDALSSLRDVLEGEGDVDLEVLEHVMEKLRLLEADAAEARAMKILNGFMMKPDTLIAKLSGGQRHTVALAASLFLEADVLLLDEPTNHLDIHGIYWLEEHLQHHCKSTVVVVSHDQDFLNAVTTDIISFEGQALKPYKGNYEAYLNTKALQLQHHQSLYTAQEIRRKRMERTIANLQARAQQCTDSGQCGLIRSRQHALKHRLGESLDGKYWKYSLMGPRPEIHAPLEEEPYYFEVESDVSDVPEAAGSGETLLLKCVDVGYKYPGTATNVVEDASFEVTLSSRIGLVGQNGTGKTTLLRCIYDDLKPTSGNIVRWTGLRIGYFDQHAVKRIQDFDGSALSYVHSRHPSLSKASAKNALGRFGLIGVLAEETPVAKMSDGQRARVVFSEVMCTDPHLLILDEPTSHMDAETAAAITTGVDNFNGAVIIASHDRNFVTEIAQTLYCTDPTRRGLFDGDFPAYKRAVLQRLDSSALASQKVATASSAKKSDGTKTAEKKQSSTPAAPATEKQHADPAKEPQEPPPNFGHVVCRHCGAGHFSHSCPVKAAQKQEEANRASEEQNAQSDTQNAGAQKNQPQSKKGKLPSLKEKSKDGKGDWTVAVSKSTMRRVKQGK